MTEMNMSKLTIVANIKANTDKIDQVKADLIKLIDITRTHVLRDLD